MAFTPVPNTVKLAIRMVSGTTNLVNTLWFTKTSAWSTTDADNLITAIMPVWIDEIMPSLSDQVRAVDITVYDMSEAEGWVVSDSFPPNEVGGQTDAQASLASAMTITFQTFNRGRSGRGRNYLSGFTEASVGAKTFSGALVSDIEQGYEAIPAAVAGIGAVHTVVSFVHNGVPREEPLTQAVVSYRANGRIYKQGARTA